MGIESKYESNNASIPDLYVVQYSYRSSCYRFRLNELVTSSVD